MHWPAPGAPLPGALANGPRGDPAGLGSRAPALLGTQVRKNSEKCIGGLLSFNPSTMGVTQLLEGPAAAVRELFTAIMVDSRHTDCRLSKEELLLSEDDYLFGAAWGMMQSETQETGLIDLPSRIWQAYHAQTASAALEQVDDPLGAVPMTPVAAFMM